MIIFALVFVVSACQKSTIDLETVHPESEVYYQIFVRSFADSNGDGIGDFNGITEKLEYLDSLGITAIWLMPIHPSPTYHGYEVTDYYDVNPDYGTMADFENLISNANNYDIRIMLDMVFNHTSSQHPWFQAALNGDGKYRSYYNFTSINTDTATKNGSWGQTIWHVAGNEKYVGYFTSTMPDLNMFNEEVSQEIYEISKFWIDKGVKGFRLDAVNHYFGKNEYLNIKYDDQANINYLSTYKSAVQSYAEDIFIIGEIFEESDYEMVSEYYQGLDSPLDFPVSGRLRRSLVSDSNPAYVIVLNNIYSAYRRVDENFISMPFVTNHDLDRSASLKDSDESELRLAAEMLLTLPGNPIIYYGEEIGMFGYKAIGPVLWDETRRLPYLWSDKYLTDWLSSTDNTLSVINNQNNAIAKANEQLNDETSLLSFYRQMIDVRKHNIALRYGNSFIPYEANTASLQGFYREYTYEKIHQKLLIIHNFGTSEEDIPDIKGKIIYLSNTTNFDGVDKIPAKSTIIIELRK
jgi:glycosidase